MNPNSSKTPNPNFHSTQTQTNPARPIKIAPFTSSSQSQSHCYFQSHITNSNITKSQAILTNRTHSTIHHPSEESRENLYRPSIKVGYTVSTRQGEVRAGRRRVESMQSGNTNKANEKKNAVNDQNVRKNGENSRKSLQAAGNGSQRDKIQRRKMIDDVKAQICGKFVGAQYIKQDKSVPMFNKKGVSQCRNKYQSGSQVRCHLQSQNAPSQTSRRSSSIASMKNSAIQVNSSSVPKNSYKNLPSYKNTGIKDIMEYQHARPYRQVPITEKCTSSNALSRFFGFGDLHEYDFRKRPEFLR